MAGSRGPSRAFLQAMSGNLKSTSTSPKKLHPLFTGGVKEVGNYLPSPPTLVHFLHLDPFANLPPSPLPTPGPSRPKVPVVFYDLDGTLIKTRTNAKFPTNRDDWVWWHPKVSAKLKKEWEEGKHLIVISNQGDSREKIKREWRAKVPLIAAKMPPGVPLRVLAALNKGDVYRKPNIGMFQAVAAVYAERGYDVDIEKSLFIGDAAGRLGGRGIPKDHSDTDYKFALNVGIPFLTPEEYFLGEPQPPYPRPPNGFHPSKLGSLANLPTIAPSNTPITRKTTEIILFVGPPASGKTSFFRKHFEKAGYRHVNQDILKSRQKCLKVAEDLLKEGTSVVVDATNRNPETRSHWIMAFHFLCPVDLARHNNMYRACYAPIDEPSRELLPGHAFHNYTSQATPPKLSEGLDEIKTVNFAFEGSAEQRKKWDMWMLESR